MIAQHILFGGDEVIVSVLAPTEALASIARRGMEPVFADLDPETMSLSLRTVEDQVTIHTKAVWVTPNAGVLGDWQSLLAVTTPRGIDLRVEGEGVRGKWERIAPGIEGMGEGLIRVDSQLINGGAEGFAAALKSFLIDVQPMPGWNGKRRDYPGMAGLERSALRVSGWRDQLEELRECALATARQASFRFEVPRKAAVAVEPARAHGFQTTLAG